MECLAAFKMCANSNQEELAKALLEKKRKEKYNQGRVIGIHWRSFHWLLWLRLKSLSRPGHYNKLSLALNTFDLVIIR
jgi:hypothetical protein